MQKKADQGGKSKGRHANEERRSPTKHDRYEQEKVSQ
jgi:hypothetical protein